MFVNIHILSLNKNQCNAMNIFVKLLLCLGITGAFKILAISKLVEPSVLAFWRKKQKRHPRFM